MEPHRRDTDTESVKRICAYIICILLALVPGSVRGYEVLYAEQFYRLYHQNFYSYPSDFNENIWYLEQALASDFANPLHALAQVETPEEWERYRYLFYMHVNLELVRQYRYLGAEYDKRVAYFYNAPWREQNLRSLEYAESYFRTALYYWEEALGWSSKAWSLSYIELERGHYWSDTNYRVEHFELDYDDIIQTDLGRINRVRDDFLAMDEDTY
jgi:hypothetical protein